MSSASICLQPVRSLWRSVDDATGSRRLRQIDSYEDMRRWSRRRLPRAVFDFVDGGAGGEVSLRENTAAFARRGFAPRIMAADVSSVDTSTTVLGHRLALPVMLSPAGGSRVVHHAAECAVAQAAGAAGTIFCVPTASTCALEEIADVASGPLWLQIFLWQDTGKLDSLIAGARAAGCSALVVTADCAYIGNHERDVRNGATQPPSLSFRSVSDAIRHPRWLLEYLSGNMFEFPDVQRLFGPGPARAHFCAPQATWMAFDRIRRSWDGPLVVKGITTVADAHEAVSHGADAVYVSNHGGRQLDGQGASIDALEAIAEAVGDRAELLIDSGVRRGEDVVKARALGARACFVGRPWYHALAVGGADGIEHMLGIFKTDLVRTLGLLGLSSVDEVTGDVLI